LGQTDPENGKWEGAGSGGRCGEWATGATDISVAYIQITCEIMPSPVWTED